MPRGEVLSILCVMSGRPLFWTEYRTRWFDDPTGNGDYEVLNVLLRMYPRDICHRPIAIEAQTVYGDPVSGTSDRLLM